VAALLIAIPLIGVRDQRLRLALLANVGVLIFYAAVEVGDLVADSILNVDVAVLGTPEFNYGVPLTIYIGAALLAASGVTGSGRSPGQIGRRDQRVDSRAAQ
jgi:hypothetical protein